MDIWIGKVKIQEAKILMKQVLEKQKYRKTGKKS